MADIDDWCKVAGSNDVQTMQTMLGTGLDINAPGHFDYTALIIASKNGCKDAVRFLLEIDADVDQRKADDQTTALMWAALGGDLDLVKLLVRFQASLTATDNRGLTPFNYADSANQRDVMEFLWSSGGRPGALSTVLVLGAGFTKGFFPNAPVLVDDYGVRELLKKYASFPAAVNVLKAEQKQADIDGYTNGKINLERLMTRLDGGMPYDSSNEETAIFHVLLADLKKVFVDKINAIVGTASADVLTDLRSLANYCVHERVDIITFNYDCLLDDALDYVSPEIRKHSNLRRSGWHPNNGYGFYCRPAPILVGAQVDDESRNNTDMLLLKIHGSTSWYTVRGASEPYSIAEFYHHYNWSAPSRRWFPLQPEQISDRIERHLELTPFIVPPVLTKQSLMEQPLLKLLWTEAFNTLKRAHRVIFVGYSFPITDIASSHLFVEAFADTFRDFPKVDVVDFANKTDVNKRNAIIENYRRIFPSMADSDFHFDGARTWAAQFVAEDWVRKPTW